MSSTSIVVASGIATVLVAMVAVFVQIKGVRDQLWLHTFAEYTRRYSEITAKLPSESRHPGSSFSLATLPPDQRDEVINTARAYLNLCSEEFYLHNRRKIDHDTWDIWRAGMRTTLQLPWIQQTWPLLRPEYETVPGFCDFIGAASHRAPHSENCHLRVP